MQGLGFRASQARRIRQGFGVYCIVIAWWIFGDYTVFGLQGSGASPTFKKQQAQKFKYL